MSQSEDVPRFTRAQIIMHAVIAVEAFALLATAAALYIPDLSAIIGQRTLARGVHLVAGYALVPTILLSFAFAAVRRDARLIDRFTSGDWRWLKSRGRDLSGTGRFNAGQKLNTAFTLGWSGVMLMTGVVMNAVVPFPDSWRTGATFVHDWLALAIVVVVTGHIVMAIRESSGPHVVRVEGAREQLLEAQVRVSRPDHQVGVGVLPQQLTASTAGHEGGTGPVDAGEGDEATTTGPVKVADESALGTQGQSE